MLKLLCSMLLVMVFSVMNCSGCSSNRAPYQAGGSTLGNRNYVQNSDYYEAKEIFGLVVHVSDGDTVIVQERNGAKTKVRLYGIDAPEKAQPYGPQATGILRQLIGNQYVTVISQDSRPYDRYGRFLGKIYLQKQDINAEMLRLGAVWHYKTYDKSASFASYEQLEINARAAKKGLWNRPNPTPPWEYRKAMRAQISK